MTQTRTRKRRLLHPYLPTATARAVTLFYPTNPTGDAPVAVEIADYGIFTVVQVTSLSQAVVAITDVIVNGEFHPVLAIGNLKELFMSLEWPRPMNYGASFHAIVRAPDAAIKVQEWCCYPKQPTAITISTSQGNFIFARSETIIQTE